ncbi:hypothetical protein [Pseudobutyrivibrio sp.]
MNTLCALTSEDLFVIDGGKVTASGVYNEVCKDVTAAAAGCIAASCLPAGAPAAAGYMTCVVVAGVVTYVWDNV